MLKDPAPVVVVDDEVPRSLHLDLDEIETLDKGISVLREMAQQHELEVERLKTILRGIYDHINENKDARGEKVKTLILKLKQIASK